jgi:hypothetical protein
MVIKNLDSPEGLGVSDRDPFLSPVGANRMSRGIGRAFLPVAGLLLVAVSDVSAQEYTLVELDSAGGTYSQAFGISENGTIAGWAAGTGAVIWDENGIVALGHPGGDFAVEARAVNDAGQVACVGEGNPQTYQSFIWDRDTARASHGISIRTGVSLGRRSSSARSTAPSCGTRVS